MTTARPSCGSRARTGARGTVPGSGVSSNGRANLDPENEISRNRDFYRSQDVRPPFTYAALIRQVNNNNDPKMF